MPVRLEPAASRSRVKPSTTEPLSSLKICVKRHTFKKTENWVSRPIIDNAGRKYCRMLLGEHSAILLTFSKLSFVIKAFVLSIFEWSFYTVTGFMVDLYFFFFFFFFFFFLVVIALFSRFIIDYGSSLLIKLSNTPMACLPGLYALAFLVVLWHLSTVW